MRVAYKTVKKSTYLVIAAILTFIIGDLVTTLVALDLFAGQIHEANPMAFSAIERYGLWILIPYKGIVFGVFYGAYRRIVAPYSYGIMIGLSLLGTVITVHNSFILLKVLAG